MTQNHCPPGDAASQFNASAVIAGLCLFLPNPSLTVSTLLNTQTITKSTHTIHTNRLPGPNPFITNPIPHGTKAPPTHPPNTYLDVFLGVTCRPMLVGRLIVRGQMPDINRPVMIEQPNRTVLCSCRQLRRLHRPMERRIPVIKTESCWRVFQMWDRGMSRPRPTVMDIQKMLAPSREVFVGIWFMVPQEVIQPPQLAQLPVPHIRNRASITSRFMGISLSSIFGSEPVFPPSSFSSTGLLGLLWFPASTVLSLVTIINNAKGTAKHAYIEQAAISNYPMSKGVTNAPMPQQKCSDLIHGSPFSLCNLKMQTVLQMFITMPAVSMNRNSRSRASRCVERCTPKEQRPITRKLRDMAVCRPMSFQMVRPSRPPRKPPAPLKMNRVPKSVYYRPMSAAFTGITAPRPPAVKANSMNPTEYTIEYNTSFIYYELLLCSQKQRIIRTGNQVITQSILLTQLDELWGSDRSTHSMLHANNHYFPAGQDEVFVAWIVVLPGEGEHVGARQADFGGEAATAAVLFEVDEEGWDVLVEVGLLWGLVVQVVEVELALLGELLEVV